MSSLSSNPLQDGQLQALLQELEGIESRRQFLLWRMSFLQRFHEFLSDEGTKKAEQVYKRFRSSALKPLILHLQRLRAHFCKRELTTDRCTVRARQTVSNLQSIIVAVTKKLQRLLPTTLEMEREYGYSKFHMGALLIRDGFTEYARLTLAEEIFSHLKTTPAIVTHCDRQFLKDMDYYCETLGCFIGILADLGLKMPMDKSRVFMEETDEDIMTVYDEEPGYLDDCSLSSVEDEDETQLVGLPPRLQVQPSVPSNPPRLPEEDAAQESTSTLALAPDPAPPVPVEKVKEHPMQLSASPVKERGYTRLSDYYHGNTQSWRIADQIKQERLDKEQKRLQAASTPAPSSESSNEGNPKPQFLALPASATNVDSTNNLQLVVAGSRELAVVDDETKFAENQELVASANDYAVVPGMDSKETNVIPGETKVMPGVAGEYPAAHKRHEKVVRPRNKVDAEVEITGPGDGPVKAQYPEPYTTCEHVERPDKSKERAQTYPEAHTRLEMLGRPRSKVDAEDEGSDQVDCPEEEPPYPKPHILLERVERPKKSPSSSHLEDNGPVLQLPSQQLYPKPFTTYEEVSRANKQAKAEEATLCKDTPYPPPHKVVEKVERPIKQSTRPDSQDQERLPATAHQYPKAFKTREKLVFSKPLEEGKESQAKSLQTPLEPKRSLGQPDKTDRLTKLKLRDQVQQSQESTAPLPGSTAKQYPQAFCTSEVLPRRVKKLLKVEKSLQKEARDEPYSSPHTTKEKIERSSSAPSANNSYPAPHSCMEHVQRSTCDDIDKVNKECEECDELKRNFWFFRKPTRHLQPMHDLMDSNETSNMDDDEPLGAPFKMVKQNAKLDLPTKVSDEENCDNMKEPSTEMSDTATERHTFWPFSKAKGSEESMKDAKEGNNSRDNKTLQRAQTLGSPFKMAKQNAKLELPTKVSQVEKCDNVKEPLTEMSDPATEKRTFWPFSKAKKSDESMKDAKEANNFKDRGTFQRALAVDTSLPKDEDKKVLKKDPTGKNNDETQFLGSRPSFLPFCKKKKGSAARDEDNHVEDLDKEQPLPLEDNDSAQGRDFTREGMDSNKPQQGIGNPEFLSFCSEKAVVKENECNNFVPLDKEAAPTRWCGDKVQGKEPPAKVSDTDFGLIPGKRPLFLPFRRKHDGEDEQKDSDLSVSQDLSEAKQKKVLLVDHPKDEAKETTAGKPPLHPFCCDNSEGECILECNLSQPIENQCASSDPKAVQKLPVKHWPFSKKSDNHDAQEKLQTKSENSSGFIGEPDQKPRKLHLLSFKKNCTGESNDLKDTTKSDEDCPASLPTQLSVGHDNPGDKSLRASNDKATQPFSFVCPQRDSKPKPDQPRAVASRANTRTPPEKVDKGPEYQQRCKSPPKENPVVNSTVPLVSVSLPGVCNADAFQRSKGLKSLPAERAPLFPYLQNREHTQANDHEVAATDAEVNQEDIKSKEMETTASSYSPLQKDRAESHLTGGPKDLPRGNSPNTPSKKKAAKHSIWPFQRGKNEEKQDPRIPYPPLNKPTAKHTLDRPVNDPEQPFPYPDLNQSCAREWVERPCPKEPYPELHEKISAREVFGNMMKDDCSLCRMEFSSQCGKDHLHSQADTGELLQLMQGANKGTFDSQDLLLLTNGVDDSKVTMSSALVVFDSGEMVEAESALAVIAIGTTDLEPSTNAKGTAVEVDATGQEEFAPRRKEKKQAKKDNASKACGGSMITKPKKNKSKKEALSHEPSENDASFQEVPKTESLDVLSPIPVKEDVPEPAIDLRPAPTPVKELASLRGTVQDAIEIPRMPLSKTPIVLTEERRKKCYMWYARLGQPNKVMMKKKVAALPESCDITEDEVDALPWVGGGLCLNVKAMNELFLNPEDAE